MGDLINLHGAQFLTRRSGDERSVLNHEIGIEIADTSVSIGIRGNESGARMPVVSQSPDVIDHYRRLDHAQMVVEIAERPESPEPVRVPLNRVPDGMRPCWLCEGAQIVEDEFGAEVECAICHGEGVIPA